MSAPVVSLALTALCRRAVCSTVALAFISGQLFAPAARAAEVLRTSVEYSDSPAAAAAAGASGSSRAGTDFENYAKEANAYGKSLAGEFSRMTPSWDGSSLGINARGTLYSIGRDELAPKADGSSIKYSSSEADFEEHKKLWNDGKRMDSDGAKQKDALFQNAAQDSPTIEGSVYQLLLDEVKRPGEDLSKDSSLQKSQDILDNIKAEIEQIVTCKKNEELSSSGTYKHVPDIQTCQQVLDRSQTCEIEHDYSNGAIQYESGPYNVSECKDGTPWCTQMWLGTVGNDYWPGSCTIYEEDIFVRVTNPQLIVSATLDYAKYDDYHQVWIGLGDDPLTKVWSGPNGNFPPETEGKCELSTSWQQNPDVDVTHFFRNAKKNQILHFRTRTSVSGKGEGYSRIKVIYDPGRIDEIEEWRNTACIDAFRAVEDGMAEGRVTCTKMPGGIDADGCVLFNGVKICRDMLGEPPLNLKEHGIDPLCQRIEVQSEFTFYKGDTGCWKAMIGFDEKAKPIYEEVCGGENLGGNLDTCKELVNRKCTFIKSECTEGMTGASGTCYVNDVTYDCGKDVKVGTDSILTNYDCKGISCFGDNCVDADRTINTNFGKISALMQMADYASEDMTCEGLDEDGNISGDQNVKCVVFGGKAGDCKIAVGGWQDCCDSPQSAGLSAYIRMTMAAKGAHQATAGLTKYASDWAVSFSSANPGASALPQGAQTVWNIGSQYTQAIGKVGNVLAEGTGYLGKAVSSVYDSVTGVYDAAKEVVNEIIDKIFGKIIEEIKKYLMKLLEQILEKTGLSGVLGGGAASGGTTAGAVAAEGAATYAAAAFAVVSWMYLAYQVANLIVQLVYKCEEEEYELDSKRDAKNCHYVGSYCSSKKLGLCVVKKKVYCCFQSALSRIVNQQIRMTQPEILGYGGNGWGSPKNPICDGIPIERIDALDWDKIDLSEWEGMVSETDNIAKSAEDVTVDRLTGKGNTHLNFYGSGKKTRAARAAVAKERENVHVRNEQALVGQDVDQLRIHGRRCLPLYVGDGQYSGENCREVSNDSVVCRENGHVVSCDEIAKDNMMNGLINGSTGGSGDKTNSDWAEEGKMCFKDGVAIDCTTIWDQKLWEEVLKDYAASIGGTVKDDKYVCTDKSGTYTENICEEAIRANSCSCSSSPGDFVCRLYNKVIDCSELGTDASVSCPSTCEGYQCIPVEESGSGSGGGGGDGGGEEEGEISDWIIDVEPTCTSSGSAHRENTKTGEIVDTKILIMVCTEEEMEAQKPAPPAR